MTTREPSQKAAGFLGNLLQMMKPLQSFDDIEVIDRVIDRLSGVLAELVSQRESIVRRERERRMTSAWEQG